MIEGDCLLPKFQSVTKPFLCRETHLSVVTTTVGATRYPMCLFLLIICMFLTVMEDMQELVSLFEVGTVVIDASLSGILSGEDYQRLYPVGNSLSSFRKKVLCTYYYKS